LAVLDWKVAGSKTSTISSSRRLVKPVTPKRQLSSCQRTLLPIRATVPAAARNCRRRSREEAEQVVECRLRDAFAIGEMQVQCRAGLTRIDARRLVASSKALKLS
jgi:hypothetical protein